MKDLFERFLEARRCKVSPTTVRQDRRYLKRFGEFCDQLELTLQQVEESHLEAYHHDLLRQPGAKGPQLSTSFRSRAILVVRLFFRWAVGQGLLLYPVDGVVPKSEEPLPRVPSVAEVQRLFETTHSETPFGIRDRLVLELLYGLGLRLCECQRLDLGDFDRVQQSVAVTGKGGHQRLLPVGPKLDECYQLYLREGRPYFKPKEPALFLYRNTGRRLSIHALRLRMTTLFEEAGLSLTPHHLRHACATHMMAAGADILRLQQFLGHLSLQSTQRYTRVCPTDLHEEFRRCHPRAYHR